MQLAPYLVFAGQCEAAFQFYEKLFNAEITSMIRINETPEAEKFPADFRNKIAHASITIVGQNVLASDAPASYYQKPQGTSLFVALDTPEEVERIFNALADNGEIAMPLEETFYAHIFGAVVDRFGTPWMLGNMKPY